MKGEMQHRVVVYNMDKESKIRKKNDNDLCFQKQEDVLIILFEGNRLLTLNATSQFLYENCDRKSVGDVAMELYITCKDYTDISFEQVLNDSIAAFEEMENNGLISAE